MEDRLTDLNLCRICKDMVKGELLIWPQPDTLPNSTTMTIPANYCPFCGRKLENK